MTIQEIFSDPDLIQKAFKAYDRVYSRKWSPVTKLWLYDQTASAMKRDSSVDAALVLFDQVYQRLWIDWKVYRGGYVSALEPRDIFVILREKLTAWGPTSGLTLLTLDPYDATTVLLPCFDALAGVKVQRSGDYPWVAASKFLHVFNPQLFPIYDTQTVWNEILNAKFKHDYRQYCAKFEANPGERSSVFNCTYTAMSGEIMQQAHPRIMPMFSAWLRGHCQAGGEPWSAIPPEGIDALYATAFEIVLIGASEI